MPKSKVLADDGDGSQKLQRLEYREWLLKRPDTFIGKLDPEPISLVVFAGTTPAPKKRKQASTSADHPDVAPPDDASMGQDVDERVDDKESPPLVIEDPPTTGVTAQRIDCYTSPALLTLARELTSNASDNARRKGVKQRFIKIDVVKASGEVKVSNDGSALPIEKFEGSDELVPSIAFSQERSSTNYDDEAERFGNGRNGVGAKGCNVFSTRFHVSIQNKPKEFEQLWENNMTLAHPPTVGSYKNKSCSTTVTWMPDYHRLKLDHVITDGLKDDEYQALCSLAFEASLCAPPTVTVYLNGDVVPIKTTESVVRALGVKSAILNDSILFEDKADGARFSISVGVRPTGASATFVAWVNGTACAEGTHNTWLLKKLADALLDKVQKRASKGETLTIKPASLKNELIVAATLVIDKPRFGSQQKTDLATQVRDFGFTWVPPEKMIDKLCKPDPANDVDLIGRMLALSRAETDKQLAKTTKPRAKVDVPKYQPAEKLKSGNASLIVTEGDSALNFAVAGLGVVGRKNYGVFPIRGKLLNCLNASKQKLLQNQEVKNLIAILGLELDVTYTPSHKTNYAHLVILSDQDPDGSHIRGLLITFLRALFPTLLDAFPDYIRVFATPLVRTTVGTQNFNFFTEREFYEWRTAREQAGGAVGTARYFKGLGSLSNALAKTLFSTMDDYTVKLMFTGKPCHDTLTLFFDDQQVQGRKDYLTSEYDPENTFDFAVPQASIKDWCEGDLTHFLMYNNSRSFPNVIDGLKVSMRKVLFSCFKIGLKKPMKVFQLVGRVAAESGYHHGDASLTGCITNMAAEYTGANNLSWLWPDGQFGSSMSHAPASSRYISTFLEPITRSMFPAADDPILTYVQDDGQMVEPKSYVPLLPVVLINGCDGIGSGWSTSCPQFKPLDVMDYVLAYLARRFDDSVEELPELVPWYRGFTGTVTAEEDGGFLSTGAFHVADSNVHVTALPIGAKESNEVVEDWKKKFVGDASGQFATDVLQKTTSPWETNICIHSTKGRLVGVDVAKELKLERKITVSNIHLWSSEGKLRKYTIPEIVEEHANARLQAYEKRLVFQIGVKEAELVVASAKRRYIELARSGEIDVKCDSKADLEASIVAHELPADKNGSLTYLTGMPTYALTTEMLRKLTVDEARLTEEIEALRATLPIDLWRTELAALRVDLASYDGRAQSLRPDVGGDGAF